MTQKRRFGLVEVLAWGLIISSLVQVRVLIVQKEWYYSVFQYDGYMPLWLIHCRYAFSWFQRIVGITAAIGLLRRKAWGVYLSAGLGAFAILTLYWKHPYKAFYHHAQLIVEQNRGLMTLSNIPLEELVKLSLIGHCLLDIMFWSWAAWVLTRPAVKAQFSIK